MQRRALLKSMAMTPALGFSVPVREVRAALDIDRGIGVHIIITAHASISDAERQRNRWIGEPFEHYGEWYLQESWHRALPEALADLPGSLSYHEYLFGEAAEELSMLVGAFRREYITYIVRVQGDNEDLMLMLGEWFADTTLPTPIQVAWSDISLRALLPDENDLGISVEESRTFWP